MRTQMCRRVFVVGLLVFGLGVACGVAMPSVVAQGPGGESAVGKEQAVATAQPRYDLAIGIALAITGGCLGAGYAVGRVGAAAMGAASERPELLTRSLLFVGLAEGIAIYGLLVAVLLWIKL